MAGAVDIPVFSASPDMAQEYSKRSIAVVVVIMIVATTRERSNQRGSARSVLNYFLTGLMRCRAESHCSASPSRWPRFPSWSRFGPRRARKCGSSSASIARRSLATSLRLATSERSTSSDERGAAYLSAIVLTDASNGSDRIRQGSILSEQSRGCTARAATASAAVHAGQASRMSVCRGRYPTRLWEAAELNGLVEEHGEDTVYNVMMSAIQAAEDRPNEDADKPRPIAATQYEWKDPSTITRRDWLYRHLLIRKFVTATVSPGGVGKSSLIAVEALAKVSGKDLLGVTPWQWPDPLAGMTGADFDKAAAAIKAGRWRDNSQAKDWAGKAVADALGLDISDRRDKAKVAGMIKAWLAAGSLIKVEGMDEKRMPKMFIEVCESS
jgi:hypothetical protein